MARVTFFAFDIAEAAQIRRIESVRSLGHDVQSFSFQRRNMNSGFLPPWPNVDLGQTENGQLARRVGSILRGFFRSLRSRDALAGSDVWIARNLDQLVIAWAVRLVTARHDAALVYECLDIHDLMTRQDAIGAVARWAERRLLARTDLVILSSEGFLREYFRPVQGREDRVTIIENKLWTENGRLHRPFAPRTGHGPLVLGWVGSLRCAKSLDLLSSVAREMQDDIRILFRGNVHHHALPHFSDVLRSHPNITYGGAYEYPDDLATVYAECDLVWAQDLWQTGANSDWLLPNRIYEASYFGCPSIAVASTETGKRIERDKLGFTLNAPTPGHLIDLLSGLNRPDLRALSQHILDMPDAAFRLTSEELTRKLGPIFGLSRQPADESLSEHPASLRQL